MVSYSDFETTIIILVCGVLGIVVAMITNVLYTNGILIDEMIAGSVTLLDLQIFTIVMFFVVGIIIAAIKK